MKSLAVLVALALATPAHGLDGQRLTAAANAAAAALPARLGAAVLDTGSGQLWGFNATQRFPFDSTHKAFACAALLGRVDAGQCRLAAPVSIAPADLVDYSPITQKLLAPLSPTLADMCAAALGVSDNTAANVVLKALGGPGEVTAFLRGIGDATSRLDRNETTLNEATPGDERDTTTPVAAVEDLKSILLGDALKPASRAQLTQWMLDDRVAAPLLRAALPADWRIADKTGAGGHGSRGIVAVIWPRRRAPVVVAVYLTDTGAAMAARNAAIAQIGAALVEALGP